MAPVLTEYTTCGLLKRFVTKHHSIVHASSQQLRTPTPQQELTAQSQKGAVLQSGLGSPPPARKGRDIAAVTTHRKAGHGKNSSGDKEDKMVWNSHKRGTEGLAAELGCEE